MLKEFLRVGLYKSKNLSKYNYQFARTSERASETLFTRFILNKSDATASE